MSQLKEPDNVWDGCEQYKEELGYIHAPAELVAFTKEKAAAEEEKQKRQRPRRRMYLPAVAAAAAFAVVVLSFPLWRTATRKDSQAPLQPYLGSTVETPNNEEGIVVQQTAVLPIEFLQENVWEEELEGVQVKFVQKDICIAAFAGEAGYTVVRGETEDFEMFRESVRLLLQNGGNVNEDRE